jgi:hypothetical protein
VFSQFGKVLDIVSLKTFRLRGQVSVSTLFVALRCIPPEEACSFARREVRLD